jgi:hypothetical protein
MFNLPVTKEIMPYTVYNEKTCQEKFVYIEQAKQLLSEDSHEQFLENIRKWGLMDETKTKYDIITYSEKYCKIDCEVLQQGYNTFKTWMLECVKINIDDVITIPSLADKYLSSEKCYEGLYKLSGTPQRFIQQAVVGGRVMCKDNEMQHVCKPVQDFDGVSLYPSAMVRMGGFLKGKPKVIDNFESIRQTTDGYFIEIIVTRVKKELHFPILSYIHPKTKTRIFTNDMVGRTVIIDNVTLE